MTRLWPAGLPIVVTAAISGSAASEATVGGAAGNGANDQVRPARFNWQGQNHRVDAITREWRVDIDWWRGRVWRAYFKLSTDTGLLVVIYQDLLSGKWYLQRLYD